MKKIKSLDVVVFIILLLICLGVTFFLPVNISIHFSSKGADFFANKFVILFIAPIVFSFYWIYIKKAMKN